MKATRLIAGLVPLIIGLVATASSVAIFLQGEAFWSWLSPGLFGITLIVAAIAIFSGVKLKKIFEDYI